MKQGFLLVELMVYITLSLTLILVSFKLTASLTKHLRGIHENSFKVIQWYTALRALEYDLETASCDSENWHKIESTKLQWIKDNKRISWKVKDKKLFRAVSHFDSMNKRWKKEGNSLLADAVIAGNFRIHWNHNQIDSIQFTLTGQVSMNRTITMEQSIWPMQARVLL